MIESIPGLVIGESVYGEGLVCLTVLTAKKGKITIFTKYSKSSKSKNLAAAQLLCYSEFVLYEKRDSYWLKEASIIEFFFDIRKSIDSSLFAYYVIDVAKSVCVENSDESEMLSLTLNTLYMISKSDRKKSAMLIKSVFEMRCAVICGFTPDLLECSGCKKTEFTNTRLYLDIMNGVLKCGDCLDKAQDELPKYDTGTATLLLPITPEVLGAMRYVSVCDPKRIFSFSLSEKAEEDFSVIAEKYLLNHLERGFESLNIYKLLG